MRFYESNFDAIASLNHLFVYALVIRHMFFVDASLAFLMIYL